ncbi:MAG: amidase, partial [Gammaproteobacteria bacterium]|nr:amidase [Gammaproteobacteria bacterium]
MSGSRREFLMTSCAALLGPAVARASSGGPPPVSPMPETPPASPPVFGTAPAAGPEVSAATFAEAEKLVAVQLSAAQRAQAAENWRSSMATIHERRSGPRRVALPATLAPYSICNPVLPGEAPWPGAARFVPSARAAGPVPAADADIAYAPVWRLSRWIETRALSSERLTRIYLERIARFDGRLRCVITLMREPALAQAQQADREIAAGRYRGPLHGIPWGAKDLLDTAGVPTTYGAEPYRDRIPATNAAVVSRLNEAGAVLIAKLSLGALAL